MKVFAGLTGGIACGKSTAAALFAALGAHIIDADVLGREVVAVGTEGYETLRRHFSSAFDGNELNRRRLRHIVFGDPTQLARLNALTHPLIRAAAVGYAARSTASVTLLVAPLLFEAGFDDLTHPNIAMTCAAATRKARLTARDGIDDALAERMLAAQWSDAQRAERADILLGNDGTTEQLARRVQAVYAQLSQE